MSFKLSDLGKIGEGLRGSLGELTEGFKPKSDSMFGRAWERMKAAKVDGKGAARFFAKAKVFLHSMVTDLFVPQQKEVAATKEASEKGAKLTEKFERVNNAIKELDQYNNGSSKEAWSALGKIAAVAGGGTAENLTFTETMNIGAFGLNELKRMKGEAIKKSGEGKGGEDALVGMLEEAEKNSAQMKLPLEKVVGTSVLRLMRPTGKPGSEDYAKNKKDFGVKLLTRLNVPTEEWSDASDLLPQIGKKNMKDGDKVVSFVSNHILKKTGDANVKEALEIIAVMVNDNVDKGTMHAKLARLAFLIDDGDYKRLIPLLLGGSKATS